MRVNIPAYQGFTSRRNDDVMICWFDTSDILGSKTFGWPASTVTSPTELPCLLSLYYIRCTDFVPPFSYSQPPFTVLSTQWALVYRRLCRM